MKKVLLVLGAVSLLLAVSCKKKNTDSSVESKVEVKEEKEELALIVFSKSACFGKCPTYVATITPEGVIDLNARANMPLQGAHTLKAREGFIEEIMERANKMKFYELKDKYDNEYVTDIPGTTLKIETTDRSKSVYARYEIPEDVLALNKFIHDEIMLLAEKQKDLKDAKLNEKPAPNPNRVGKKPYPIPKEDIR